MSQWSTPSTGPSTGGSSSWRGQNVSDQSATSNESYSGGADPFRKGFPVLHPLPLYSDIIAPGTDTQELEEAQKIVTNAAKSYLSNEFTVSVVDRCNSAVKTRPKTTNENPTCLVVAKHEEDETIWPTCLGQIEFEFSKRQIFGLTVEFVDPERLVEPRDYILHSTDRIITVWPKIRQHVLNVLMDLDWSTLSVLRRGTTNNPAETAVTVLIGAPDHSSSTWHTRRSRVRDILNQHQLQDVVVQTIGIRIPLSALDHPGSKSLGIQEFSAEVPMGASIGPQKLDTAASLGGAVTITKGPNRQTCFMSVFHMFRTIVGNEQVMKGFPPPGDNSIKVVAPANPDFKKSKETAIESYEDTKQRQKDAAQRAEWAPGDQRKMDLVQRLIGQLGRSQNLKDAIQKHNVDVGALFAASGFDNALDWSLIEPGKRSCRNTAPTNDQLSAILFEDQGLAERYFNPGEVKQWSMERVKSGETCMKRGRTTGLTVGELNALTTDTILAVGQKDASGNATKVHFSAWLIINVKKGQDFCAPGDSGAWVLDWEGNWIGMVCAESANGHGLMLPVDRLVKDIKEKGGCDLSLPRSN